MENLRISTPRLIYDANEVQDFMLRGAGLVDTRFFLMVEVGTPETEIELMVGVMCEMIKAKAKALELGLYDEEY